MDFKTSGFTDMLTQKREKLGESSNSKSSSSKKNLPLPSKQLSLPLNNDERLMSCGANLTVLNLNELWKFKYSHMRTIKVKEREGRRKYIYAF